MRRSDDERHRWRGRLAPAALGGAVLLVWAGGCSATGHAGRPVGSPVTTALQSTTAPPSTTTTTTADPGVLPQTDALPSAGTPAFDDEMAALWEGVVTGSTGPAMAAFFPETAYLQVKTVADPAADYEQRLVAQYSADIAAAHQLFGAGAAKASLTEVRVPAAQAHWVPPGVCANRVGYYEVANSRIVYEQDGVERSFGIASLISWRGVWYVVHLGAIVRSGSGGTVLDPGAGPGTSPPSSTC